MNKMIVSIEVCKKRKSKDKKQNDEEIKSKKGQSCD